MAKTIWKFPLRLADTQDVEMPSKATILSVAEQNEAIVLYAVIDSNHPKVKRTVHIVGTGHVRDEAVFCGEFAGTVKLASGSLMFHVFVW